MKTKLGHETRDISCTSFRSRRAVWRLYPKYRCDVNAYPRRNMNGNTANAHEQSHKLESCWNPPTNQTTIRHWMGL
ncbi:unnamed protein product [Lasius platythorax]|uniref:Uncharacterized protein n=1 Tax=Lasius platythorax TaxID=488582 RepID=A0AAV2NQB8_9HYME